MSSASMATSCPVVRWLIWLVVSDATWRVVNACTCSLVIAFRSAVSKPVIWRVPSARIWSVVRAMT